ncbi:multiple RNA-binding domain-containing protein 1 [Pancytospora philotis]|nr:multiple RNA-binding domain-containing protein 1 [Pancytospora philotis]
MRVVVKNLPKKVDKSEIEAFFSRNSPVTDVYMLNSASGAFRRVCFIGYKTGEEAQGAQQYFNNAMFCNHKITVELADEEAAAPAAKPESQERRILYSKTVLIRGLGPSTTESMLEEELQKIGRVTSVKLTRKDEKTSAVVLFREGVHAVHAFQHVRLLLGMRVKVGVYTETEGERKKEYYNTLFFNFDTVVKRTCEMEKIDKRDLVNLRDGALGSRIALLETNLVEQTRLFLEHNGIFLDRITEEKDRKTLILRNSDIFGVLELVKGDYRVDLAPSKCLALLVFGDEKEALEALKALNMRRFKNNIIYCEFAPLCNAPAAEETPAPAAPGKKTGEKKTNKIVVKNVPFQASVDDLKNIFSSYAHVVDIRLPIKSDKTHRGFAFIILDSPKSVDKAIGYFGTSTHLYGRRLVLERAKL